MKTIIKDTIFKTFRVHWNDGEYRAGYRDFETKKEAQKYVDLYASMFTEEDVDNF